jgi:type VI secretion system secreted protein VgrG
VPGVYQFSSVAQLTGILILDGGSDPNARFDFLIGSTLTTDSGSSVQLINGAQAGNVFWQVGTSATLDTGTKFFGSILANDSITLDTGTSVNGRALALTGAVTMDDNFITAVPEPGALWPLVICASVLGAGQLLAGWWRKARGLLRAG